MSDAGRQNFSLSVFSFVKIAHIQFGFSIENGGPTRSLSNYCRGQVAAGHEVSVWTLEGFPHFSPAIRLPPPVEMHVFRVEPPTKLGRSAEMRRQLRLADSPDVYHLHGVWLQAMHYGADEARRRNRPYVLEMMGMYEPWGLRQKWFLKRVARWWFQDRILRESACLHVNSNQEADYLRKLGFKSPIAVIPVGVDLQQIEKQKAEILKLESGPVKWQTEDFTGQGKQPGEVASQKFHGPGKLEIHSRLLHELGGRPFVLYLSRLHPKKGLDLLIRSFAKVRKSEIRNQKFADWVLVIAGSGAQPYVEKCRRLAADLGIAKQCLWLGHVDEVQKSWLFAHARCYALPTSSENFGNTVAEALAHGTPVITTRHTPWKDLEEHGCGWFVDNTETEIGRALHEVFILNASARGRMSDSGQRLIRERYSLRAVLSDINAVYEWVLGGGPKPDYVRSN
jgi:glycosyltransferase involved in cell wall biosynthesis